MSTATATPVRMAYVPGSIKFDKRLHEQRTERYRTWHSSHADVAYGVECLLCGDWGSGYASRGEAASFAAKHARFCHVVNGCHCPQPHLTAAMAARIGVTDEFPYHLSGWLFCLAGGVRRFPPPQEDLNRAAFGGPEFGSGGYRWTR